MGKKGGGSERFTPYSELAHPDRGKRRAEKRMTYDEIVQTVIDKM